MNILKKNQQIENGFISASKKHLSGSFSEHSHDFFEIEYVINGNGNHIINGVCYPMREKMLFFISPSDFHSVKDCDSDIINVMFSCNLCDTDALYSLFSENTAPVIHFPDEDSILIEKLLLEIADSNDTEYAVQFLRCVLYKIASLIPEYKNTLTSHIKSAIIHIMENFRAGITLNDTAAFLGLAPSYLSSLFLQKTGINFKTYLDNVRFDYTVKLLVFSDMSVSEICFESGFSDYANFTRRFKIRYGCTPSEYRKIQKKSNAFLK